MPISFKICDIKKNKCLCPFCNNIFHVNKFSNHIKKVHKVSKKAGEWLERLLL